MFSLTFYVKIDNDISISVGVLGFRYNIDLTEDEKTKKVKVKKIKKVKKNKNKKLENESLSSNNKPPQKKTLSENIDFATRLIKSLMPNFLKMLQKIRVNNIDILILIGCEFPDQTALLYGQISIAIYNIIAQLKNVISVNITKIKITPDFTKTQTEYNVFFKVKLRLCHILFALFGMLIKFVGNTIFKEKTSSILQN